MRPSAADLLNTLAFLRNPRQAVIEAQVREVERNLPLPDDFDLYPEHDQEDF